MRFNLHALDSAQQVVALSLDAASEAAAREVAGSRGLAVFSVAAGGRYQLVPGSPGYDAGARIPNFNDDYRGRAPDIGAAEAGAPAMRFGLHQSREGRDLATATRAPKQ